MQFYPDFPTMEPRGGRTLYAVLAVLANGKEIEVGEWTGDADAAGAAALSAYRRYHRTARVEVWADGAQFAYVTHHPRTHDKTPVLCQPGFCPDPLCGQIPPAQCDYPH
ncbi:hypothetical protein [Streptomyces sp. NPDC051098]|uniref:hypothetical protein n=1 Tax=Streptomyces sp. NPDC051098 TaxID=3155411 RepID=UPI003439A4F6